MTANGARITHRLTLVVTAYRAPGGDGQRALAVVVTWTKLSDDFGDECAALSDAAFRTHVEGLLWVMRRETGGALTPRDVRRFAETTNPLDAIAELVGADLWRETTTGWHIVHGMNHQPTPEEVQARKAQAAARSKAYRARRGTKVDHA